LRLHENAGRGASLGTAYMVPSKERAGMRLLRNPAINVLGETVEFPKSPLTPVANVSLAAGLYEDPACSVEPGAIMWANYELSVGPPQGKQAAGDIGIAIKLEITPHSQPYSLPDSIHTIWDELDLEDVMPCPERGPLGTTQLDGRSHHLRALANFLMSDQV
jgi:hypothetical protein